jgi:uncharacterized protein YabN with tetrapyrrole methylase and pyrophosphatase domain
MVRRHPHVFGDSKAGTSEEVLKRWAEIKKDEKKEKKIKEGYLEGIPEVLPALLRAHKVSQKAARAGFDWKDISEVMDKLAEETEEFRKAVEEKTRPGWKKSSATPIYDGQCRTVLSQPRTRSERRSEVHNPLPQKSLNEKGADLSSAPMEEMERLWQEAKGRGRKGPE